MKYLINKITREILKLQETEYLADSSLFENASDVEIANDELLSAIQLKLKELDDYQDNDLEIRELTINNYFKLSLSLKGRNLILEQIQNLEQKAKLGLVNEENALFEYFYNGGSVEISLSQLRFLYIFMTNNTNTNYGVYQTHIFNINNLQTIKTIKSYNFKENYLKNQNINF